MRIAYVGPNWGTSRHRADALGRLGHGVTVIDPWSHLGRAPWVARWLHHGGAIGVGRVIDKPILREVQQCTPELVWVDQGPFLGPGLIGSLRATGAPIVNYTIDNPFEGRDALRFRLYLRALPYYDLVAVVRESNRAQAARAGARHVTRVYMSADEVAHRPGSLTREERNRYASEVAFVGTWMPERGPFLAELVRLGVPISIWGDRWHKAREWRVLEPHWRGPGLYDERYAKIVQAAKLVLGLLSKDNRDLHTTRSMEIPALGAVLCAERTSEHLALYRDGREAVFWDSPGECAALCHRLLSDDAARRSIARLGRERSLRNGHYNEQVLTTILRHPVLAG